MQSYIYYIIRNLVKFNNEQPVIFNVEENDECLSFCRLLLENTGDAIVVLDRLGRITCWNSASEVLFGYSRCEVKDKAFIEVLGIENSAFSFEKILNNKKGEKVQVKVARSDGKTINLEFYITSFVIGSEDRILILAKSLENSKSENLKIYKLYNFLLANLKNIVFIVNRDGTVVFVNSAIRSLNYDLDDVIGENLTKFVYFEDEKRLRNIIESGTDGVLECRVLTKNGEMRYLRFLCIPLHKNGKVTGYAGVAVDITDVKIFEEKLRESEKKFRLLAEKSLVGVYIIQDNKFTYVNPKAAEILGYDVNEIIGMSPVEIVHPEDRELVKRSLELRVSGLVSAVNYSFRIIRKDGSIRYIEVFGSRMVYEGKPTIIGTLIDITEKKELEEELKRLNRLLTAVTEINQLIVRRMPRENLLKHVCRILVKTGDYLIAWAGIMFEGMIEPIAMSGKRIARRYLRNSINMCEIVAESLHSRKHTLSTCKDCEGCQLRTRLKGDLHVLVLPLHYARKLYGAIGLISKSKPSDEEVRTLADMSRNISLSLRHQEILQQRRVAVEQIKKNLEQFEFLSDKLRNPLAIIRGYLEIKDEIDKEKIFSEIEKQVTRLENAINELRREELKTYHLKKLLGI